MKERRKFLSTFGAYLSFYFICNPPFKENHRRYYLEFFNNSREGWKKEPNRMKKFFFSWRVVPIEACSWRWLLLIAVMINPEARKKRKKNPNLPLFFSPFSRELLLIVRICYFIFSSSFDEESLAVRFFLGGTETGWRNFEVYISNVEIGCYNKCHFRELMRAFRKWYIPSPQLAFTLLGEVVI